MGERAWPRRAEGSSPARQGDDAPQLGHGRQDHLRLGHADEQVAGGDRGALPVRHVVRQHRRGHPPAEHHPLDGRDGRAQLGWPDMRLPILYTLSWPERVMTSEETWPRLDFLKMGDLTFRKPDNKKYPSMDIAYAAGRA